MKAPSAPVFATDETDLEIVGALQINPRATWAEVGRVLGIDASTVARRWARLADAGAAWVSCQPLFGSAPGMAFVEIRSEPGHTLALAEALAADPEAMTIDIAAGARDLLVTVVAADHAQLATYLLERVPRLPHVRGVTSHVVVGAYADASGWRLRSLNRRQEQAMRATLPRRQQEPVPAATNAQARAMVAALSRDGREPLAGIAAAIGASESTARRRLGLLMAHGTVRLRCELARELTGWPVSEWLFARVPADRIDTVATSLAAVPEVRAVLSAAGPFNLLIAAWLRTVADGQRLETQMMRRLPHVEVVDRSVVIRPFKLAGRMLDPRGFATGVVPLYVG